jgi:hypothetical protein
MINKILLPGRLGPTAGGVVARLLGLLLITGLALARVGAIGVSLGLLELGLDSHGGSGNSDLFHGSFGYEILYRIN